MDGFLAFFDSLTNTNESFHKLVDDFNNKTIKSFSCCIRVIDLNTYLEQFKKYTTIKYIVVVKVNEKNSSFVTLKINSTDIPINYNEKIYDEKIYDDFPIVKDVTVDTLRNDLITVSCIPLDNHSLIKQREKIINEAIIYIDLFVIMTKFFCDDDDENNIYKIHARQLLHYFFDKSELLEEFIFNHQK